MDMKLRLFQTDEIGKVDLGGSGTIAYIPALFDMNVLYKPFSRFTFLDPKIDH